MENQVVDYYNTIAKDYDKDRFGNSYGKFVDYQERRLLTAWNVVPTDTLDLACGTGRLTNFASMGADASEGMLAEARERYPEKEFVCAPGQATGLDHESFDTVISFHLMMHLEEKLIGEIIDEMHRILKPGGRFIFDIPSAPRRRLLHQDRGESQWHGNTSLSRADVERLIAGKFAIRRSHGIMMAPVHKLPQGMRKPLRAIDYLMCGSVLKKYSSYLVYELVKL